jgi:hypothetical protein
VTVNTEAPRAPYSLEPAAFPLPALAHLAGRAPLGGSREIVLACLLVARAVADSSPPAAAISRDQARARAKQIGDWLAASPLAGNIKAPLVRLAEATGAGEGAAMAAGLESVIMVTANHLDSAARLELGRLAQTVEK